MIIAPGSTMGADLPSTTSKTKRTKKKKKIKGSNVSFAIGNINFKNFSRPKKVYKYNIPLNFPQSSLERCSNGYKKATMSSGQKTQH